ncbi:hypothetical protein [Altererythrobacter sp. MTPC7]|uniref:hypothetical protein n=1 Tax=Altererythrobacter sp. MTPC7 TaxID=3056567 RepID=UPI0036F38DED
MSKFMCSKRLKGAVVPEFIHIIQDFSEALCMMLGVSIKLNQLVQKPESRARGSQRHEGRGRPNSVPCQ